MRKIWLLAPFIIFGLSSCQWNPPSRPSVLVIAVEGLGFDSIVCREEDLSHTSSGIRSFCEESLRFTHAFTPSTLSQSSLASILTGEYPYIHGVRHNGSHFLSGQFVTSSEVAEEKGYATGFFSGGPPIFFKSGLGQGFQVFDDNVPVLQGAVFRSGRETMQSFFRWLAGVENKPFFSVVYLPDLQFPDAPQRDLAPQSQMEELDEALAYLVRELKARKLWNTTNVFLLGLNGHNRDKKNHELSGTNLFSENTQVTLFAKPAGVQRDRGLSWKVDRNVSLVDVGQTLFDLLESAQGPSRVARDQQVSLKKILEGGEVFWPEDRPLLLETAWPQWRGLSGTRYSVRIAEYLVLHDTPPRIYNTLTDRSENNTIAEVSEQSGKILSSALAYFEDRHLSAWSPLPQPQMTKLALAEDMWIKELPRTEMMDTLEKSVQQNSKDMQLTSWLAELYARNERWGDLLRLGIKHDLFAWSYLADQYRMRNQLLPPDACWSFISVPLRTELPNDWSKGCDDELVITFAQWVHSQDEAKKEKYKEKIYRDLRSKVLDRKITRLNYSLGLPWDTRFIANAQISKLEIIMMLPQFKRYAEILRKRMETQN